MTFVETVEELEALYGQPGRTSLVKVADRVTKLYGRIIEASPFCAMATVGPEGLDCSPRGDFTGFVRIKDEKTLLLPDRRGNNRIDSLKNIVRDPRIALMFLLPGSGNALRVNGKARISVGPDLLDSFAVDGKAPRSVTVIEVDEVYFQCARAIIRAGLWDANKLVDPALLPTPGEITQSLAGEDFDGEAYDRQWPERAKSTMW